MSFTSEQIRAITENGNLIVSAAAGAGMAERITSTSSSVVSIGRSARLFRIAALMRRA